MKAFCSILLCAVCVALSGCIVTSLHPLYTESDQVLEADVLGTWLRIDEDERWVFQKHDDEQYQFTLVDADERRGDFVVRMVRLDGHLFLDLLPAGTGENPSAYHELHRVATHSFLRVYETAPVLKVAPMDYDWLEELLEKDPKAVPHVLGEDDRIILTGKPAELQSFMRKHLDTKECFGDMIELVRREHLEPKAVPEPGPDATTASE